MKLCKDCKHYEFYRCYRKMSTVKSIVTGENKLSGESLDAENERESILLWKCGKKARYWKALT